MAANNYASSGRPAGLIRRLAAVSYDTLILAGLVFFLTLVLVLARGGRAIPSGSWWYGVSLLGAAFLYFGWFWTLGGQTPGARAWRLRVETAEGSRVDWRQATVRFLAAWLLLLPPGLGFVWALRNPNRLCWHDQLSETRVVYEPGNAPPIASGSSETRAR